MSPDLEQLLQDIGALAMEAVPEGEAKVLVWAEQEGGTISADLISGAVDDEATFRLCPPLLEQLIGVFWEDWRDAPGAREWIAMAYVIENGGYTIDLSYEDDFEDREEEIDDLRLRAIEKHFGAALIDYSRPG